LRPATNSLSYTLNGSTDDPRNLHGLNSIHRVSDTPRPSIVLADEPTANLDSATTTELVGLMARLNQELGITFVIGTHDPRVMDHSQRHIELLDGRIASDTRS